MSNPSLSLASPDDPSIATTDLISYLVTGEPAAVVLGQQDEARSGAEQAVALGLRLVGSYASGGWICSLKRQARTQAPAGWSNFWPATGSVTASTRAAIAPGTI